VSFSDRDGVIWMDGELVPWREAKVHVLTHTLHYGMGVFEGVRAYETDRGTAIFRLEDHTRRLFDSAKIMRMQIPFDKATLDQAQLQGVEISLLTASCVFRFRGNGFTCRQSECEVRHCNLGMGSLSGC